MMIMFSPGHYINNKTDSVLSDTETQCEVMQEIVDLILEVSSLCFNKVDLI